MNRFNLRLPGWDGTPLALDVHLPEPSLWPVPTVVTRTPYGRGRHLAEGAGWVRRGFGYVVQDVRGRYDSDGVWECYRNERGDGAALADWIAAQEWSDGRLVGYGGSYGGYTAWALAVERPELVPAVVSMGPSMALHRTKFEDGVLRLAEHAAWWLERADSRTSRDGLAALLLGGEGGAALAHLPVTGLPERLGARLPGWAGVILRGPGHRPGEEITEEELAALPTAGLHVGGWYDLLADETLLHWRTVGAARAPRPPQRLIMGPWGHDLAFTGQTRHLDREHGPQALLDLGAAQVTWIRACLAGEDPGPDLVLPVGGTTWRPWPTTTREHVLHAHPEGRPDEGTVTGLPGGRLEALPANGLPGRLGATSSGGSLGDGPGFGRTTENTPSGGRPGEIPGGDSPFAGLEALPANDLSGKLGEVPRDDPPGGRLDETPGDGPCGVFVYDPADPCPSLAPGTDRRVLDGRPDVLRFSTPPLTAPLSFTSAAVHLDVTASAPGADWIVRLAEHTADGRVFELARGRAAGSGRLALSPVWASLPVGSRLRLEITGSDFPRLARSLGTGADRYTTTATAPVRQRVRTARLVLETPETLATPGAGKPRRGSAGQENPADQEGPEPPTSLPGRKAPISLQNPKNPGDQEGMESP
ncbi:CocE/NonD family hydrolase [Streptosporangium saharense]|uniref:CocE/NonD family hydrolase n=1 Tax=Streptosporangium saharense TaxID=1706840 RepID=UPI0036BDF692